MKNRKLSLDVFIKSVKLIAERFFAGEIDKDNKTFSFIVDNEKLFTLSIDMPQKLSTQSDYSDEKFEDDIRGFFMQNIHKVADTVQSFTLKYGPDSYCVLMITMRKVPEYMCTFWNTPKGIFNRKYIDHSQQILNEIIDAGESGMTLTQITLNHRSISPIQKKNILSQLEYENKIKVKIDKRRGKSRRTYFAI